MKFPGVYRGIVVDNDDTARPSHVYRGLLKINVPQVYGVDIPDTDLPWAEPCLPFGGGRLDGVSYGFFALPQIGSTVWIMFENADAQRPVWMGTWFGEKDATPELADEAVNDSEAGVAYPEIFLLKFPWMDSGYIRVSGDKKMEFVFGDGEKYIRFDESDDTDKILEVKTKGDDWSVNIHAEGGALNLIAADISIVAENSLTITGASMTTYLTSSCIISADASLMLISGEGEMYGQAPKVAGFETRDNSDE